MMPYGMMGMKLEGSEGSKQNPIRARITLLTERHIRERHDVTTFIPASNRYANIDRDPDKNLCMWKNLVYRYWKNFSILLF